MSYDPKCEDLARHFLTDARPEYAAELATQLAQVIQAAIDDWISEAAWGE